MSKKIFISFNMRQTAMLVGENGIPIIFYFKKGEGAYDVYPMMATLKNGEWQKEVVVKKDTSSRAGMHAVLNQEGQPCMVYDNSQWDSSADIEWGELIYIEKENGAWNYNVVRATAKKEEDKKGVESIERSFLGFDKRVIPHIVYELERQTGESYRDIETILKHARKELK